MATWLENQRDKARREKLSRELTHTGTFDNEAIRAQRWNELASAPGQLAQGAFTGLVGAPVDIANMALRPIGLGSDRPVGGSASLASLIRADEKSLPYQAGTMLPISPEGLAIGGAKLAGLAATFAGKGAKTANLVKSLPAKTEFELAHEVAQRNAALPVEQGGLGLPPNNTAMDRAKAMGFDTPAYHGSGADIQEFKNEKLGGYTNVPSSKLAHFFAETPRTAEDYTHHPATIEDRQYQFQIDSINKKLRAKLKNAFEYKRIENPDGSLGKFDFVPKEDSVAYKNYEKLKTQRINLEALQQRNIDDYPYRDRMHAGVMYPVQLNVKNIHEFDQGGGTHLGGTRKKSYFDVINENGATKFLNTFDSSNRDPDTIYAITDPSNIRSRFAAFDPMQRNSANLLAGGAAGAIGLSSLADLLNQQEYQ